jgi:hypothetical protein
MARRKPVLPATFLLGNILLALQATGCGTTPNRVLLSVTVAPAIADARNFSNGQVQFAATGTFSRPPSPAQVPVPFVAPYSGTWFISDPTIATISQSGVAQCQIGASGIVTATAEVSSNSCGGFSTPNPCMSTAVRGTAKLICP